MTTRDFSKVPNYVGRKMFLDSAGPVTTQRFDEYAYPKIAKFDEAQRASFWVPEEINLSKDRIDFTQASEAVKHIFTSNLLRQTTLDSIQGRAPAQIFVPVISVPELESLVTTWTWFELIHSRAYSHIIRNIYNIPKDEFNKIHDNEEIIAMTSSIGRPYDNLHTINCIREVSPHTYSTMGGEYNHIKAIYLALIASYGLEAIRFTVSFATSLAMVENKIFMGNGSEISLILSDEMLHVDWTAYLINTVVKNDPRFAQAAVELREEAMELLQAVIAEEKQWAKYLFKKGSVIGLNERAMVDFVDFTAANRLKDIGFKHPTTIKTTPIPWYNKHLDTDRKQQMLQEVESVNYVVSGFTNTVNYDQLPNL